MVSWCCIFPKGCGRGEQAYMSIGIYVYCVAPKRNDSPPELKGLDGASVFLIESGDLYVFVHECKEIITPKDETHLSELALSHAAVIDAVWDWAGTVLPMNFSMIVHGTDGRSAEENLRHWLEAHQGEMSATLEKFSGKVELGIQVFWEPEAAAEKMMETDPEVRGLQERLKGMPQGAAYLYRQKLARLVQKCVDRYKEGLYRNYLERFQPYVGDMRENPPKTTSSGVMLMNLSVLACRDDVPKLGQELAAINQEEGMKVRFTGPWPPYSFTSPAWRRNGLRSEPEGVHNPKNTG